MQGHHFIMLSLTGHATVTGVRTPSAHQKQRGEKMMDVRDEGARMKDCQEIQIMWFYTTKMSQKIGD